MNVLGEFQKYYPRTDPKAPPIPKAAGVFVVARYLNRDNNNFEILYCGEAKNISKATSEVAAEYKFDGFERNIFYFIKIEKSKNKRIGLLKSIQPICKQTK